MAERSWLANVLLFEKRSEIHVHTAVGHNDTITMRMTVSPAASSATTHQRSGVGVDVPEFTASDMVAFAMACSPDGSKCRAAGQLLRPEKTHGEQSGIPHSGQSPGCSLSTPSHIAQRYLFALVPPAALCSAPTVSSSGLWGE